MRFREYGEPTNVLRLEDAPVPEPGPGAIRMRIAACGLNPADWALCRGLFAGTLPRGIGLDIAGTVDAVGEGVTRVRLGEPVFGPADFLGPSAGLADRAIAVVYEPVPPGLDLVAAAALPMAVETAYRYIDELGVEPGTSVLVHGAGTTVGFAAVQMCLRRNARVFATAGATYADRLRTLGAKVTAYGEGMVDRVRGLVGAAPDHVFEASPGALSDLLALVDGDARRIITVDFAGAKKHGALGALSPDASMPRLRYDVVAEHARLAAEGSFTIPIARTFPLEAWREAMALSLSGHAHGKVVVVP